MLPGMVTNRVHYYYSNFLDEMRYYCNTMAIQSINPANGQLIKNYNEITDEELLQKLSETYQAFTSWKLKTLTERLEYMRNLSNHLKQNTTKYASDITLEMGKPVSEAEGEIKKCASLIDYYIENAANILSNDVIQTEAQESYVRHDPLGVIFGIMPWNYPFWQAFRYAVPAMIVGNTCVLKHASNVPMSALNIEKCFRESGFPENTFQTLLISTSKVESVIENPAVKGVALTGSDKAGSIVASIAGKNIKKCVMELGGSDPFIVLKGADVKEAAKHAAKSRLKNTGQACNAAKRFIVEEEIVDEFVSALADEYQKYGVGDPNDSETVVGCLANQSMYDDIKSQVDRSVEMGAKIVSQANISNFEEGYFYPPVILDFVTEDMPVFNEETFGPAAPIIRVKNPEEAIEKANKSIYGLGASLWSNDLELIKKIIPLINSGNVFVNSLVKSDPRLPFGGVEKSGFGRELSSYGLKEFVNIKTVWIE